MVNSEVLSNHPRITVTKHMVTLRRPDEEEVIHLVPATGLLMQLKLGSQWIVILVNPEKETVDLIPVNSDAGDLDLFRKAGAKIDPPGLKKA